MRYILVPRSPLLAIAPIDSIDLGSVNGTVHSPCISTIKRKCIEKVKNVPMNPGNDGEFWPCFWAPRETLCEGADSKGNENKKNYILASYHDQCWTRSALPVRTVK